MIQLLFKGQKKSLKICHYGSKIGCEFHFTLDYCKVSTCNAEEAAEKNVTDARVLHLKKISQLLCSQNEVAGIWRTRVGRANKCSAHPTEYGGLPKENHFES